MKFATKTRKKGLFAVLILFLLFFTLYQYRFSLLKSIGSFLIKEDPVEKAEAMFVLSGRPFERGLAAMDIFYAGYADRIVCLGSVVPQDLKSLGYNYKESELIQHFLSYRMQIPEQNINILPIGTSTFEESEAILKYCKEHGYKKVLIVSSSMHTRRVQFTFKDKFAKAGIQTIIRGHIRQQDPPYWWQNEQGIIIVNNEYIKILYYWLKY